jgi:O-antigen/teichoic acid export membrane protein
MNGLRTLVYRGGGYLAARQLLGMVLSAGGMLLLTRLLGPAEYGLYAAALALQMLAATLAAWGIGTYLVRLPGEEREEDYHHAVSFLLVAGAGATLLWLFALPLVEQVSRLELGKPALLLFLVTPIQLVATVPMARIERKLDFRTVAHVELAGQFAFFVVGVTLAFAGFGVWAPVLGLWAQHIVQSTGYFAAARYRPRWLWSTAACRDMLSFGTGYSTSIWLWQARRLVNPMVVGRYMGSEAVAYVALATQIAAQFGFIVGVAWRLSTAALAKIQTDAERTARAIAEGMHLQALAVGPPLVAFGWVGEWAVPLVFGEEWRPVMQVYPAVALAFLTSSVFLLHSSALYVRRRSMDVALFHVLNLGILAAVAWLLVPGRGLQGYAFAEIAALASYLALQLAAQRHVGSMGYATPASVWLAFAIAILLPGQVWLGAVLVGAVLLDRSTRELAMGMWKHVRGHAYDA